MPGANAFLAPEHKVVLSQDADRGRRTGRPAVQNPYLGLRNYTDNLLRRGFTDADIDGSGRDALIDALVAHGSPEMINARVDDHLTAGADHLGIHVLTEDPTASPVQAFRVLAEHRHAQWEHDGAGPLEQAPGRDHDQGSGGGSASSRRTARHRNVSAQGWPESTDGAVRHTHRKQRSVASAARSWSCNAVNSIPKTSAPVASYNRRSASRSPRRIPRSSPASSRAPGTTPSGSRRSSAGVRLSPS